MGEKRNMDVMVSVDGNTEQALLVKEEKQPVLKHLLAYKHLLQNLSREEA